MSELDTEMRVDVDMVGMEAGFDRKKATVKIKMALIMSLLLRLIRRIRLLLLDQRNPKRKKKWWR